MYLLLTVRLRVIIVRVAGIDCLVVVINKQRGGGIIIERVIVLPTSMEHTT